MEERENQQDIQALGEMADLSQVWLDITVYPNDVAVVKPGQRIQFISDSLPQHPFTGRINYIQPVSQDTATTFIARANLDNRQALLKPGMFGQVVITQESTQTLPFIPEAALQKYGKETFVFLVVGKRQCKKQIVKVGHSLNKGVFILDGISPGDRIVTHGSFTLKAELLKNQLSEED